MIQENNKVIARTYVLDFVRDGFTDKDNLYNMLSTKMREEIDPTLTTEEVMELFNNTVEMLMKLNYIKEEDGGLVHTTELELNPKEEGYQFQQTTDNLTQYYEKSSSILAHYKVPQNINIDKLITVLSKYAPNSNHFIKTKDTELVNTLSNVGCIDHEEGLLSVKGEKLLDELLCARFELEASNNIVFEEAKRYWNIPDNKHKELTETFLEELDSLFSDYGLGDHSSEWYVAALTDIDDDAIERFKTSFPESNDFTELWDKGLIEKEDNTFNLSPAGDELLGQINHMEMEYLSKLQKLK